MECKLSLAHFNFFLNMNRTILKVKGHSSRQAQSYYLRWIVQCIRQGKRFFAIKLGLQGFTILETCHWSKNVDELYTALNKTVDATKTNMQDTLSRFQLTEEYRKFFTRYSTFKSLGWQEKQKNPEANVDNSKRRTKSRARSVIEFFIGASDNEHS